MFSINPDLLASFLTLTLPTDCLLAVTVMAVAVANECQWSDFFTAETK
jgi:hypothetical protein